MCYDITPSSQFQNVATLIARLASVHADYSQAHTTDVQRFTVGNKVSEAMVSGVQRQHQLCVVLVSCCIQLMVSRVTSLSSTSTCDVVRFRWVKSEPDGEVLCATAPSPTVSASINTKDECSRECAHNYIGTCAAGFNYKHDQTLCELFANQPTTLQVLPGCEYYAVCCPAYNITVTSVLYFRLLR